VGFTGELILANILLLLFLLPFLVHDPHMNGTSGYTKAGQMTYLGQIIYFSINNNPTISLIIMFINLTIRDQPLPSSLKGWW
jgi:hypothetical protein